MWPPQSVKTWPTPASLSVRATRCPPVRSVIAPLPHRHRASPELLPPDALAVHPLAGQHLPHPADALAPAAAVPHPPISSATNRARRGSARLNTKLPVGPLKLTASPTSSARSHCEPMPPGATSTASVSSPFRVGEETMLHARTSFGPNGTEIHWPA